MILLFLLFFIIMFPFLYNFLGYYVIMFKNKNYVILIFLLALAISIPILRYSIYGTDDASRHFYAAYSFSLYNNFYDVWDFITSSNNGLDYDYYNYPLFALILYFFSGFSSYTIISFTFCIITYFCFMYPIVDLYNKYSIKRSVYALALLAVILSNNYRYTTSGMRYCSVIAILIIIIYLDSRYNFTNKKFLPLYFIPILIHQSAILYFLIRLFYFILRRNNILVLAFIIILYPMVINGLPIIDNVVNLPYIDRILTKIEIYESNEAYSEFFTTTLKLRIILSIVFSLVYIFIYYKIGRLYIGKYKSFIDFTLYVSLLNVSMSPYQNLIDRNVFILFPLIIISLQILMTKKMFKTKNNTIIVTIIFSILCFMGILYNRNYPVHVMDFSIYEIVTSNIVDFFTDLPRYIGG